MSQKTIDVTLTVSGDVDILVFGFDDEHPNAHYVNLNSPTSQNELKNVFSKLLQLLLTDEIDLRLIIAEGYKKGLYRDVCTEFINDLNRELLQVKETLKRELT